MVHVAIELDLTIHKLRIQYCVVLVLNSLALTLVVLTIRKFSVVQNLHRWQVLGLLLGLLLHCLREMIDTLKFNHLLMRDRVLRKLLLCLLSILLW